MRYRRMAAVASTAAEAQAALADVAARYPLVEPDEADVIIALGGDGSCSRRSTACCARASRSTA